MMWHKLWCATVLNISSPDPNQSNAVIMPTCSNLSVGFWGRSFSTLVKLTVPCTSCRRPAAVPVVHLHPGRMRRGCGYPGGGCVLSHMLLHEEETQVHPSAFRWVENAVAAWDEPHRGLCVCAGWDWDGLRLVIAHFLARPPLTQWSRRLLADRQLLQPAGSWIKPCFSFFHLMLATMCSWPERHTAKPFLWARKLSLIQVWPWKDLKASGGSPLSAPVPKCSLPMLSEATSSCGPAGMVKLVSDRLAVAVRTWHLCAPGMEPVPHEEETHACVGGPASQSVCQGC